ncbi:MAG: hypothetical protein O2960_10130 [Verrucomicrobia bacterium]|nr:hypothetical protein [Verrucomicrobiota bacterium]
MERIAGLQETHAKESADLRKELAIAEKQARAFELKLASAEAKLEK